MEIKAKEPIAMLKFEADLNTPKATTHRGIVNKEEKLYRLPSTYLLGNQKKISPLF